MGDDKITTALRWRQRQWPAHPPAPTMAAGRTREDSDGGIPPTGETVTEPSLLGPVGVAVSRSTTECLRILFWTGMLPFSVPCRPSVELPGSLGSAAPTVSRVRLLEGNYHSSAWVSWQLTGDCGIPPRAAGGPFLQGMRLKLPHLLLQRQDMSSMEVSAIAPFRWRGQLLYGSA